MLDPTRAETAQDTSDNYFESDSHSALEPVNTRVIDARPELRAMHTSFELLSPLDNDARNRAVRWLLAALEMDTHELHPESPETARMKPLAVGTNPDANATVDVPLPRSFMSQKKPNSLVERIACLAYYLSFYRDKPHFKTSDFVQLNTEAAGAKFGNPSRDADNADRQNGYLVTAGRGLKQITPRGEAVVQALPDRDAVKAALREYPYKVRRPRDASSKRSSDQNKDDK
ncbi:hypothetical protein [Streptomyces sp. HNM1019]|uniref:hypothetical protein n=1 Tax=Streptomyces sp. HNM1019 TaxID=3424717 RepID=UPI003D77E44A